MEPIIDTKEYLKRWEDIIDTVDMEGFPIDLARSVSFNIGGETKKTIDIEELQGNGYTNKQIEEIILEIMLEYPKRDGQLEFKFNIIGIALKAQAITDQYLKT